MDKKGLIELAIEAICVFAYIELVKFFWLDVFPYL